LLCLDVIAVSYALAAVGCLPAASCRSHDAYPSWSKRPVVFVAADRRWAKIVERLVGEAGCGFSFDPEHALPLLIEARSIEETTKLARLVLDNAGAFATED